VHEALAGPELPAVDCPLADVRVGTEQYANHVGTFGGISRWMDDLYRRHAEES
jgi:hypothetical protein